MSMPGDSTNSGLDLHLREGGPGISLRGSLVVLVTIILAATGGLGYVIDLNRRAADAAVLEMSKQHAAFVRSQDRLGCIVSLNPEERTKFRAAWRQGAYREWCPWMDDDGDARSERHR